MAFLTESISMSISRPVADETVMHLFASASGTNSFAFSSEQNKAMLGFSRAMASWSAAVLVAITPAESLMRAASCPGVVINTMLALSLTSSSTFSLSFSCGMTKTGLNPLLYSIGYFRPGLNG